MFAPRRFKSGLALALFALAACDTGTPAYMGLAAQRVEVAGMVYDVRVQGLMAEALRQNVMGPRSQEDLALSAAAAMRSVTGCDVLQLRGDPSVMEGRLKCGDEEAPAFSKQRRTRVFLCAFQRATIAPPVDIEDYEAFCA